MRFKAQALSAALLLAIAIPVSAQQPRGGQRGPGAPGPQAHGIEAALRLKQELKLTDAQVSQLETLRKQVVETQKANAQQMIEVRSQIASGALTRADARKQHEAKREAMQAVAKQRREEFEKILTEEQLDQLHAKMWEQTRYNRGGKGGAGRRGMNRGPGAGLN